MQHPEGTIFQCTAGSHAYGLANEHSDVDVRGVFMLPPSALYVDGLLKPASEDVRDEKSDIVYHEAKKFVGLLAKANPSVLELLFMPDDCVTMCAPPYEILVSYRRAFVTNKARWSFGDYARSQIDTAIGQNKMIANPYPEKRPTRESMCYLIDPSPSADSMPCRPIPLAETGVDLSEYAAAACERLPNTFRLYHYGKGAKGVFRGDMPVVCESIPIDDEKKRFRYLMLFDESRYERECKNWKKYWDWMKSRNAARWTDADGSDRDCDCKKMSHCIRLLHSCLSIFENGEPMVRFTGQKREFVMDIKAGKYKHAEILDVANGLFARIESAYAKSTLPDEADADVVRDIYLRMCENHYAR
jgi:uncharacterized protein